MDWFHLLLSLAGLLEGQLEELIALGRLTQPKFKTNKETIYYLVIVNYSNNFQLYSTNLSLLEASSCTNSSERRGGNEGKSTRKGQCKKWKGF